MLLACILAIALASAVLACQVQGPSVLTLMTNGSVSLSAHGLDILATIPTDAHDGDVLKVMVPGSRHRYEVQVPAGAKPGQVLSFTDDDSSEQKMRKELNVLATVPAIANEGDVLEVAVPGHGTQLVAVPAGVKAGQVLRFTIAQKPATRQPIVPSTNALVSAVQRSLLQGHSSEAHLARSIHRILQQSHVTHTIDQLVAKRLTKLHTQSPNARLQQIAQIASVDLGKLQSDEYQKSEISNGPTGLQKRQVITGAPIELHPVGAAMELPTPSASSVNLSHSTENAESSAPKPPDDFAPLIQGLFTNTHTHTRTHAHTHKHTHTHVYKTHKHAQSEHTHTHMSTHTRTHFLALSLAQPHTFALIFIFSWYASASIRQSRRR